MTSNRERITDQYDRLAYEQILKELNREPGPIKNLSTKASGAIGAKGRSIYELLPESATSVITQAMEKSFTGFHKLIREPSFRSIAHSRVKAKYQNLGHPITSLDQIRELPLKTIDQATPPLSFAYAATMALEGGVAGAAVTGATFSATFATTATGGAAAGPSMGLVVGAIAADTATVLAASMRAIAHVGAYFGHDLRSPEEQVFALSIINWSESGTSAAKTLAFQELSQVTQLLLQNASKKRLGEHAIVRVVEIMMKSIGFKMTKKRLGVAIPAIGIVFAAGLNANYLHSVAKGAQTSYRLRHLMQKYDLNPAEFGSIAIKASDTFDNTFRDSQPDDEDSWLELGD